MQGAKGRRVYIHLDYDLDAALWQQRYNAGLLPDKTPYGYHHLETWGYHLTFSKSHEEGKLVKLLRRAAKRFLGFDLWHAWRNRDRMGSVEAILTNTEREYLAILLLRKVGISSTSPLLVANSIWLYDIWEKLSRWKHRFYHWLVRGDERTVLTAHSGENLKSARSLFRNMRCELMLFGISLEAFPLKPPTFEYNERGPRPLRLLSLGNDPWRDWETLIGAVEGNKDIQLRIGTDLSREYNRPLRRVAANSKQITVEFISPLERLREAYEWADIVVVTTMPNRHASGLTVALEAVTAGKPVIATDTGGLKGYFNDDEIYYVPARDIEALATAIKECVTRGDATISRAENAQAKLLSAELTAEGFASRHVALIENVLSS